VSEPLLQVLDPEGQAVAPAPEIPPDDLRRLFRHMLELRLLDQRMLSLQRQGRIGFYGTATGQEAAITGSAYAWRDTDWVFPALRELGVSRWRGTSLGEIVCQLIGNSGDVLLGRQMPCHFSDRKVHTVAWSSVIGTQLPHAMGAAYAAKLLQDGNICIGYLGDGASSAGDFHAALNFAGVFRLPVVFFCQNNQWAISVPLKKQTHSRTIAQKALAYGLPGIQVDGNDVLAVYAAAREAVDRARAGDGPTLIECVTYRLGVHTTADDPTKYRTDEEVAMWEQKDPLTRFRAYLEKRNLLEANLEQRIDEEIAEAVRRFESAPPADPLTMFDHVYAELPADLKAQREEMAAREPAAPARAGEPPMTPGPTPMRGQRLTRR